MAMMAANGRLPDSAPMDTLEGAKMKHAASSTTVDEARHEAARQRHLLEQSRLDGGSVAHQGRTLAARRRSKASVNERTEFW